MMKIGITGSLASGKTTASKILSNGNGPLFSADNVVRKLYSKKKFTDLIKKKFKIKKKANIKKALRDKIIIDNSIIKKLEMIIHPIVRREMKKFIIINKKKNFYFLKFHY